MTDGKWNADVPAEIEELGAQYRKVVPPPFLLSRIRAAAREQETKPVSSWIPVASMGVLALLAVITLQSWRLSAPEGGLFVSTASLQSVSLPTLASVEGVGELPPFPGSMQVGIPSLGDISFPSTIEI